MCVDISKRSNSCTTCTNYIMIEKITLYDHYGSYRYGNHLSDDQLVQASSRCSRTCQSASRKQQYNMRALIVIESKDKSEYCQFPDLICYMLPWQWWAQILKVFSKRSSHSDDAVSHVLRRGISPVNYSIRDYQKMSLHLEGNTRFLF